MSQKNRSRLLGAGLAAFTVTLAVVCGLAWPMPLELGQRHLLTPFGDSHVWVFHWVSTQLGAGELPELTYEAGYPQLRRIRLIGWAPALASLPLQGLLGPLAAVNLAQLLSLPISALAAMALVRRWTGVEPLAAAALGVCYAMGPTLLSTFGMGEISNTQAWTLPLFLWCLDRAQADLRWAVGLFMVSFLTAFSSPYYGLALPLLVGGWVSLVLGAAGWRRLATGTGRLGRAVVRQGVLLATVAAGLWPAHGYYVPHESGGGGSIFQPARFHLSLDRLPYPYPSASPLELVLARAPLARSPYEPVHVSYLGLALVLVALVAVVAAIRGWRLGRHEEMGGTAVREETQRFPGPVGWPRGMNMGLFLVVLGTVLALGPYLTWGGHYVRLGESPVPLPVRLLEVLGYPTRWGGLYFRYSVVASLGLVVVIGAGLCRVGR
ncbi:MAG: hypothetical protein QGG40_07740, partial [Myxococcota bacterium]|nr:hypothetical protein [Myxococcota bacterium]